MGKPLPGQGGDKRWREQIMAPLGMRDERLYPMAGSAVRCGSARLRERRVEHLSGLACGGSYWN